MSTFTSLLRRADTLRRVESGPERGAWWTGYMRGLRRAHRGENFGTDAEHELWLSAADSWDSQRAALGRGYRAGLTLEFREPDAGVWCQRCERSVVPRLDHGDSLCPNCALVL